MNQIDLDIILNDIPALWTQTADDISYDLGDRVDQPDHFNSFIEIRNVNGVVASIVIELGETNYFFIYVWPDFKGNPYPLEPIVQ
uniref:DUF4926 domain-containing protein n=1 Tax=Caenorhabditis tropicalis TaxID=1561998 RepID=A0A1I7UMK9_9PELO